jgi:hypothetical protein
MADFRVALQCGTENTSSGWAALFANTIGSENTAAGGRALYSNTSDIENTAIGEGALFSNSTGSQNIAYGYHAGYNLTTGSNDLDIGNAGVAAESGTIRIGTPYGPVNYGLIAEEVAKVYPELVIRGEKGAIDGVRYDELAPMLLNEMQQQQVELEQRHRTAASNAQMLAALRDLRDTGTRVAMSR